MLDKLWVDGSMKNYLIAINTELKTFYSELITNYQKENNQFDDVVTDFCDNITATLDYYTVPIYNKGRNIVQKNLNIKLATKNDLTQIESNYIEKYKIEKLNQFNDTLKTAIIACFNDRISDDDLCNQIMEVIMSQCLKLFKVAQLLECQKNSITKIKFNTDENSCFKCQTLSKFSHNVDKLINNIDDSHSFCKFSINLQINIENQVNLIKSRLNISFPELVTSKTFKMVNDIIDEPEFILLLQQKFNSEKVSELKEQLKNQISYFTNSNEVLISKSYINELEYIITSVLLKDKLLMEDFSWWKENYFKRQESKYVGNDVAIYSKPFINYIAEQNPESYFLESCIAYILQPKLLKSIDLENYDRLKTFIFKDIEFLRG